MAARKPAVHRQRRVEETKPKLEEDDWGEEDHIPDDPTVVAEENGRKIEMDAVRKAEEARKMKELLQQQEAEEKAHAERVLGDLDEAVEAKKVANRTERTRTGPNTGTTAAQAHFAAMRACLERF